MRRVLALAVVFALLLSGCGARSYVDISPHIESAVTPGVGGELEAANYAELKSAIVYLVEQGREEGTIGLVGYSGSAEEDLRSACSSVTNDEPIGSYGVEYMSFSCVKVLANYEATVSITYSRTAEEIAAIKKVSGSSEYRAELERAVENFESALVVETPYYAAENYDAAAAVRETLASRPLLSVASPTVEQSLYPSSGLRRIVETTIDYGLSAEELETRRRDLRDAALAAAIDGSSDGEDTAQTVRRIARNLCDISEFLPEREDDLGGEVARDSTFTAYGALVEGAAASEGYALALAALCSICEIDCVVVGGRWDGIAHYWNLVRVGGDWYHVDAALCEYFESEDFLLKTDAEIGETLKWNAQSVPAADGEPIVFAEPAGAEE